MNEVLTRIEETPGESARHLSTAELEAGLRAATRSTGHGAAGAHHSSASEELAGDFAAGAALAGGRAAGRRLEPKPSPDPTAQLTVMQTGVAELIANGQSLALFGDNLFVDLDLSVANLPIGSRLRVGGAVVEVTPMPHDGCHKFNARFGNDALRFVNTQPTRHLNLRGIYWRVIEAGEIEAGSPIQVLARPELGA